MIKELIKPHPHTHKKKGYEVGRRSERTSETGKKKKSNINKILPVTQQGMKSKIVINRCSEKHP